MQVVQVFDISIGEIKLHKLSILLLENWYMINTKKFVSVWGTIVSETNGMISITH